MKPIISGTTGERMLRSGVLALLIAAFSAWYLYDGFMGYPENNRAELLQLLGRAGSEPPAINPDVTVEAARAYLEALESAAEPDSLDRPWGSPSIQHEGHGYHVGPGGYLRLAIERGRVTGGDWNDGVHSETDLQWQKFIGLGLAVVALILIIRFVFVATTRVTLTESGLKLRGRPPIRWDAMTALRADDYDKSETVELTYTSGDRSSSVRLDTYTIARLPEIIAEICTHKGLHNPIARSQDEGPPESQQRER